MKNTNTLLPEIVSREEWLKARKELLVREKALTRSRDRLNADRRNLPMVEIKNDYTLEAPGGKVRLLDLFKGRRQLIVYHFMFHPDWAEGCSSCSAWADHVARGHLNHLHKRTTTLVLVSRAPISKIISFKKRMGWTLPWYSSYGSGFNYDFHITLDESVRPVSYNYRDQATLKHLGYPTEGERPGISCFLRIEDTVYHTYSTYARGVEQVGGACYFLDLTALGRQEEWEEPRGRASAFERRAAVQNSASPL
ncbi:DUF899 domain-containing protein [Fodinibius sediminis]|uniref:Predicted dithiol-disulfide oxidoreductase, DUF899 family n=1 Tax=Fodinibius sediminis TaxID=1214077 RepID=A0A521BG39_9BACT|nr:DUF899 domain-containing protein [Fodinibius sediminis]SMO46065.1 Predicted dithiol-disulfide oxidoreductase, DUF899 family [Fodinibius sediminis]